MTAPSTWSDTFRVRYAEVGRNNLLRPDAAFDFFQQVAGDHAAALGCGFNQTTSQSVMWVLSRMQVEFLRMPHSGEALTIKTWPSGFDRLLALREYLATDAQGEPLMRGTSFWVLLDFQNGRPLRLPDALPFPLPDNSALPQFFPTPPRISQEGLAHPMEGVAPESMIDVNQHLNNARYITFVTDWLARELGGPARLAELSVVYNRAIPVGTRLVTTGVLEAGGMFRVRIDGAEEGAELLPRFLAQGRLLQDAEIAKHLS